MLLSDRTSLDSPSRQPGLSAHETGADTGSIGWQYDWSEDIARQSVLRTHTTGISTKHLHDFEPPIKMFSVGRVFRRETFDYKHLPEFHQVEGLVCDEGISYHYTKASDTIKVNKKYLVLFIIPILSLLVLYTNKYHNLFYE